MTLIKLLAVLLTLGLLQHPTMGGELSSQRMKRSLTTICVEIKPSGPLEEPYYMCKGTDLPPLVPKDSSASYQANNPETTYGAGSTFRIPSPAYNAQYQGSKSDSYQKQPANINQNQNNGPGYEGFRRPASQSVAAYQPPTNGPVQQPDGSKQQFFPKPSEYPSQQNYDQQQKQQQSKSSSPTQSAPGYGFSAGNQQATSYTPSNSPYVSESGATQAQPAYDESGRSPSGAGAGGGSGAFVRSGSSAAAPYGSGTKQHSTNSGASGSFAKSSLTTSLPAAVAAKTSFGQSLPYAHAAAAQTDVEEHGFAKATPPNAFMVPAVQKSFTTDMKTKNPVASTFGAGEQPKSDQNKYGANVDNVRAAALHQPGGNPKTEIPDLKDYRAMLSEDIFQSPTWGFSPDEFASFRSLSDEVEQTLKTQTTARSQGADNFQRNMPAEYADDPVMRQFYKSLHEPLFALDPLVTKPIRTPSAYNSQTAKLPPPARPLQPAPLSQRAPPKVKQPDVINSRAVCETTTPPPPPPRQPSKQCYPDSIAASPYSPPTRLTTPSNCEPCNRRDYNFQPVFIALPCYGQPTGFGNFNTGAATYLSLGIPGSQTSYPSPMNQYTPNLPGEAAFGPIANIFPATQSTFPGFIMPYVVSNPGSMNPAANRASSAEENGRLLTPIKSKLAARKPATSNERDFSSASLGPEEYPPLDSAKSTETTNNDITMNTSMETAETKATQPAEASTSVTEATLKITDPESPPTNARSNGSIATDVKDAKNTAPTTEAIPVKQGSQRTYDSIMSMAQEFSKMHQKEFIDIEFDDDDDDDKTQLTPVMKNLSEEKRKEKRQGAAYRRQIAPGFLNR